MTELSLVDGLPEALAALSVVYLLGVGGPEDASGIGRVESFVWRFHTVQQAGRPPVVLAFSAMPRLMSLTRAVNGQRQGTLPTEAIRVRPADLQVPQAIRLCLDPTPEDYHRLAAGATVSETPWPGLEGPYPT